MWLRRYTASHRKTSTWLANLCFTELHTVTTYVEILLRGTVRDPPVSHTILTILQKPYKSGRSSRIKQGDRTSF